MTGSSWSKCLNFRRQGAEDCQINGCDDDNATKVTDHGQNVFRKHYSTHLPQLGLHTSSGHLAKEACCTMAWHTNIKDECFPLMDNKTLTGSNLSTMLITSYKNLVESYNNSEIKWKCGNHFLLTLLPTLCEWCVQDSVFRSGTHPTNVTTTHVIRKFSRHKEWAECQRKKIANLAENQLKDATKHHNKVSQEILTHLLNQIKNIKLT